MLWVICVKARGGSRGSVLVCLPAVIEYTAQLELEPGDPRPCHVLPSLCSGDGWSERAPCAVLNTICSWQRVGARVPSPGLHPHVSLAQATHPGATRSRAGGPMGA